MVLVSLYGVQYGVCEEITCETNEILLIHQTFLFKRERRGDSHCVIANRLKRKQRQRVPASDRHGPCLRVFKTLIYKLTARILSGPYENLAVSKLVKTAINTAINTAI